MTCDSCNGSGYLETTEDRVERCDGCKFFPTDEEAFQRWVAQHFLPLIDAWKVAKRNKKQHPAVFAKRDAEIVDRYRVYRNTNKYLNITERRVWWQKRREEFEEMERRAQMDDEGFVPPNPRGAA